MKEPKLSTGKRFSRLVQKRKEKKGVSDVQALAASIGRKKYGNKKMQAMASKGKKRT